MMGRWDTRGKVVERARARDLRAQAWTINEIVAQLGVSKSSVSVWVRDVEFDAATRPARSVTNRNRGARNRRPNRLQQRKQAEIRRRGQQDRRTRSGPSSPVSRWPSSASPIARFPIRPSAARSIRWVSRRLVQLQPHSCAVMGLVTALLSFDSSFRGSSVGRATDC